MLTMRTMMMKWQGPTVGGGITKNYISECLAKMWNTLSICRLISYVASCL